jgi:hypothetical protein
MAKTLCKEPQPRASASKISDTELLNLTLQDQSCHLSHDSNDKRNFKLQTEWATSNFVPSILKYLNIKS